MEETGVGRISQHRNERNRKISQAKKTYRNLKKKEAQSWAECAGGYYLTAAIFV